MSPAELERHDDVVSCAANAEIVGRSRFLSIDVLTRDASLFRFGVPCVPLIQNGRWCPPRWSRRNVKAMSETMKVEVSMNELIIIFGVGGMCHVLFGAVPNILFPPNND